ncbi:MAG TPA: UvrB/UvrC motif-containing protein [Rhabdochlamydiaceae bacterium]|jgi:protein arginine kinase activator
MAERPVECAGHCKRPLKIIYKEIVGDSVSVTEMCNECPVFEQKLHGQMAGLAAEGLAEGEAGLCCSNCRTTLESVLTGNPLGCSECYPIFSDVLISELISDDAVPAHLKKSIGTKKNQPLHIGKSPDHAQTVPASNRLTALNEELNEALKKENYEKAAWLRDQIKALLEKGSDEGKK